MAKKREENAATEKLENLKKELEKLLLENSDVKLAAVIFTIGDETEPQVFRKGHFYDNAMMVNQVMAAYRAKAAVDLGL